MIRLLARYRVEAGSEEAAVRVVGRFVRAVRSAEPHTEYRAFRLTDDREFIHLMAFVDEAAREEHRGASYTLELVEGLYPLCEVEPTFIPVEEIDGS